METITVDHRNYPLLSPRALPDGFNGLLLKNSIVKYAHGHFGRLICQQLTAGNIALWYTVYRIKEDCTFYFKDKKTYLGLHAALKNNFEYTVDGLGVIAYKEGQANLVYLPAVQSAARFEKDHEYASFDVLFDRQTIKRYAGRTEGADQFMESMSARLPALFHPKHRNIPFATREIIDAMMGAVYEDHLRHAYLQIKSTELLFYLLLPQPGNESSHKPLNGMLVERLHETKRFIEANYLDHVPIEKLSRMAGVNTTTFKIGFKQEFGMGPFEFLFKIRMGKAIGLIKEGKFSVAQIADASGYKSVGSFIKAFKQHYHCTPGVMRLQLNS